MRARTAAAVLLLGAGGLAASRPIGGVPALGPLLDPAHGVWAARAAATVGPHDTLGIAGLGAPVRIVYDRRHVPHIFAATELDAYRALGYVVARDRLFQLEIQALASSGRLTEFAGAAALPLDRETRRLGLPRAAEAKLRAMSPAERAMLDAYAGGVNAYIATLGAADLPVEFRLTNTRPAPWRAIDALHVMNRMGYTLAFQAREVDRAAGRVSSAYDTGITGWDPDPDALHSGFEDPQLTALQAPLTSAMIDLYARTLKWPVPNQRYELLNNAVNRGWTWGSGRQPLDAMSALKGALALNGKMRVLVAHGFTDLVTPYFASKLLIAQIPPYGDGRLGLAVYPGGHMFYSRTDSRAAFHRAAEDLFAAAMRDRATGGN